MVSVFVFCAVKKYVFFNDTAAPVDPGSPHYRDFKITFRHTTGVRTPLDE